MHQHTGEHQEVDDRDDARPKSVRGVVVWEDEEGGLEVEDGGDTCAKRPGGKDRSEQVSRGTGENHGEEGCHQPIGPKNPAKVDSR